MTGEAATPIECTGSLQPPVAQEGRTGTCSECHDMFNMVSDQLGNAVVEAHPERVVVPPYVSSHIRWTNKPYGAGDVELQAFVDGACTTYLDMELLLTGSDAEVGATLRRMIKEQVDIANG